MRARGTRLLPHLRASSKSRNAEAKHATAFIEADSTQTLIPPGIFSNIFLRPRTICQAGRDDARPATEVAQDIGRNIETMCAGKRPDRYILIIANFEQKQACRIHEGAHLPQDLAISRKTVDTAIECQMRVVDPHLRGKPRNVSAADIGRIGDDEIKFACRKRLCPIAAHEMGPRADAESVRVAPRRPQRLLIAINPDAHSRRAVMKERQ